MKIKAICSDMEIHPFNNLLSFIFRTGFSYINMCDTAKRLHPHIHIFIIIIALGV